MEEIAFTNDPVPECIFAPVWSLANELSTIKKANSAVIKLLAKYLGVAPSSISLLRGQTSRNKRFLVKNGANGL